MTKIYYIILLLLTGLQLPAQEIVNQPVEAQFITSFPFRHYTGGVMVLRAKFDNVPDTLNFILDTGSGGISLDSATCTEFNIVPTPTDTFITGMGGMRKVPFVFNKTLHLPGLSVEHLNFHVNDYDVLTSVYGEKVDGIIGYSFFSRYIVKIDFDSSLISVYSPGKIRYPDGGTTLHPAFTSLPIQRLKIKDKRNLNYNFYFDTGAGLCLLMSEQFAKDSGILLSRRKPVKTQAEGMAGKFLMKLTVIKEVKIGPFAFRRVPTYIYDDEYNVTAFPFTGGLLGNDLLRHFNMIVNYPAREIHLVPNTHYFDEFDYGYTGLAIYYTNGKIMVDDVIEKSPGARAGLKPGDEIFAVGNNFSYNIQVYKNLLQVPDKDIKLLIKRDEKFLTLTIHTESIR